MKEIDPDDPLELACGTVAGDPAFLARCIIEEFASLGYDGQDLFVLFREPSYPMLNAVLAEEGEARVRGLIDEVLAQCGRLKVRTEIVSVCRG